MTFPLYAQTHDSFVQRVYQKLGKGRQHASLLYKALMRHGSLPHSHPAFNNCPLLLEDILASVDCSLPEVIFENAENGTGKRVIRLKDGLEVETVLIPMQAGGTLCISSQVGCRMACQFCETGRMGLLRSLTTEEIVSQVYLVRHVCQCDFRNIVFMGMGEPFDNYEAVLQASKILSDACGLGFGYRQMTISTSGCVEGIRRFSREGKETPQLAVSINAPEDALRNRLMPINRKHNLQELYAAMQEYNSLTGRQILIAYVLLKDHNDSLDCAEQLALYLRGLDIKINIIPYNPQSCDRFQPPECEKVEAFMKHLRSQGYYTLLRVTKGRKLMAGCGQLGNLRLRKSHLKSPHS
jgi:23S rRNA (adenine2503-C2)-methyltransferase